MVKSKSLHIISYRAESVEDLGFEHLTQSQCLETLIVTGCPLTLGQMLAITTQQTKGISLFCTSSDDISVDEYLKARIHMGRKSMLTCSNLKFVSSDDVP